MRKYYDEEDLQTDIAWFDGYGIDEKVARSYIKCLLGLVPTKKLEKILEND